MKVKLKSLAVIVVVLAAFATKAQAEPHGKLYLDQTPTTGAGTLTARGGYSAQAGWKPGIVKLFVLPIKGGLQGTTKEAAPAAGEKWGPLNVGNLTPGSYAVYARMDLTNGGVTETLCSDVNVVPVGKKGGAPATPVGSVSYAAGDPKTGAGSISVTNKGTYTIAKGGFKATACRLTVIPLAGGETPKTYTQWGPVPAGGNWGAITINKLPKGLYAIVGQVTMSDGKTDQAVQSPVSILSVP